MTPSQETPRVRALRRAVVDVVDMERRMVAAGVPEEERRGRVADLVDALIWPAIDDALAAGDGVDDGDLHPYEFYHPAGILGPLALRRKDSGPPPGAARKRKP